jgi:cathepsin D
VAQEALSDAFGDSEYYASISVGTPAETFQVIMDTGSADLWLVTAPCRGCDTQTPLYNPSTSSSATTSPTLFSVKYGSGAAQGTLVQDSVSISGFGIQNQIFGAVTTASNVVSGDVSGILGCAWQSIATSQAKPLLQALAAEGALTENIFSFALTRWTNVTSAGNAIEPGGVITIGSPNASLYTGSINWVPITDSGSYWLVPLQAVTVGGNSVSVSAKSVAIDTGTTLIGAPAAAASAIYAAIPGSQPILIQGQSGYWGYPCETSVNLAFQFGGVSYSINDVDFNSGQLIGTNNLCAGAIFELGSNSTIPQSETSTPAWIVGDAFIKNVYASFRFSPDPAVGFATLSSEAIGLASTGGTSTSSKGSLSGAITSWAEYSTFSPSRHLVIGLLLILLGSFV